MSIDIDKERMLGILRELESQLEPYKANKQVFCALKGIKSAIFWIDVLGKPIVQMPER